MESVFKYEGPEGTGIVLTTPYKLNEFLKTEKGKEFEPSNFTLVSGNPTHASFLRQLGIDLGFNPLA
jgi:hypothetical protein